MKTLATQDTGITSELLAHTNALYNFAMKMTKNQQDSEDLLQETYYKAIRYKHYYEPGTKAKSWLFRIMQNNFINNYRKNSKRPAEYDVDTVYLGHHYSNEIDTGLLNHSLNDELSRAINSLENRYKVALILCDVEDFSYIEIAKIMDIPVGTVKTYIHKARKTVKAKLETQRKRSLN